MIVDQAKLIGDPHLGLKFERGVPLHRRGEREKRQFEKFVEALHTPDVDFNVMVGDLFEHPFVGHGVVVRAAEAYLAAAEALPDTTFIAMAGNHDRPRNLSVQGAWDSFVQMVDGRFDNLFVVDEPRVLDPFVLLPWQWDVSAVDQVSHLRDLSDFIAIGHYDLRSYGGDDSHLYPTKQLAELGVSRFYGGHYHVPGEYVVAGHTVHCTGSLEPYSHGEDPSGEIYVTVPLSEVETSPDQFRDKCVRVILKPGETLPENLDCLALTPKYETEETQEIPEVQMDGFDWKKVLDHELKQVGDDEVVDFIKDRL